MEQARVIRITKTTGWADLVYGFGISFIGTGLINRITGFLSWQTGLDFVLSMLAAIFMFAVGINARLLVQRIISLKMRRVIRILMAEALPWGMGVAAGSWYDHYCKSMTGQDTFQSWYTLFAQVAIQVYFIGMGYAFRAAVRRIHGVLKAVPTDHQAEHNIENIEASRRCVSDIKQGNQHSDRT